MQEEYNSSENEEPEEENFSWYKDSDPNTYFTFSTKHKNGF